MGELLRLDRVVLAGTRPAPKARRTAAVAAGCSMTRDHLPEYAAEAFGLGLFMMSACGFGVLLFHPASPVPAALPSLMLRSALMGLAMGLTCVLNMYSPWGRRSGAHLNPSVTLAFYRLGKLSRKDAVGYILAQFVGGLAGTGARGPALSTMACQSCSELRRDRTGAMGSCRRLSGRARRSPSFSWWSCSAC